MVCWIKIGKCWVQISAQWQTHSINFDLWLTLNPAEAEIIEVIVWQNWRVSEELGGMAACTLSWAPWRKGRIKLPPPPQTHKIRLVKQVLINTFRTRCYFLLHTYTDLFGYSSNNLLQRKQQHGTWKTNKHNFHRQEPSSSTIYLFWCHIPEDRKQ